MLHVLNRVARTLPSSLDLQQAVEATRSQLTETFDASVVGLLTLSEVNNTWAPLIAEGLAIPPTVARDGIPDHLQACLDAGGPLLVADVSKRGLGAGSGSGIYTALRTRGKVVGLLAIEHPTPNHYTDREAQLLAGLAEALALTIDNARWFRRLRILGASASSAPPHPRCRRGASANCARPPRSPGPMVDLHQLRARTHQEWPNG